MSDQSSEKSKGASWTKFYEPFPRTLARNFAIAVAVAIVLALRKGNVRLAPSFALLVIWFSLGGHYVEVAFLNVLRGRLPSSRATQTLARIATWFVGGAMLYIPMTITYHFVSGDRPYFEFWWAGGLLLVGIEIGAHLLRLLRGLPNFYTGAG